MTSNPTEPKRSPETIFVRYQHRERSDIEFDVEVEPDGNVIRHTFRGEQCFRIRTVRNLSYPEEVHQPAFTYMPADNWHDVYERVV